MFLYPPPPPHSNETTKLSNEALAQLCEMMKIYTLEERGLTFSILLSSYPDPYDPYVFCPKSRSRPVTSKNEEKP
jgi:hypothetical protein